MAKILTNPLYPNGWPFHVPHSCFFCGTEYAVEEGDRVFVREHGTDCITVCPNCLREVRTFRPSTRRI